MISEKENPYSNYWKRKLESAFMKQFHGLPCEICRDTFGTHGHHLLPKSHWGLVRYDKKLIVVLCAKHHNQDNFISAESRNWKAREQFELWLLNTKPEQVRYMTHIKHIYKTLPRVNYKDEYDKIKAS